MRRKFRIRLMLSDLPPMLSDLLQKSPEKQKSPVPNERDEAYARGSTLLPSD